MTLLLLLALATIAMTQIRAPHRWGIVTVIALLMGGTALLQAW